MTNLAKILVLDLHNQNPNITTVEMLKVLLQWLHSNAWESEFSHPWQQWICHLSVAWYTYRQRPLNVELIAHYHYGFLITVYACLMSHSFYITKPHTFLLSFLNSNVW